MSDKHNPDRPANPSQRRLFTFFTDRQAAGEIGAELGRPRPCRLTAPWCMIASKAVVSSGSAAVQAGFCGWLR